MEYQLLYKAAAGCPIIQKNIFGKDTLLAYLRSFATEPLYRDLIIVSVHQIKKFGAYGNGRRAKKLNVAKLIEEAKA